MEHKVLEHPRLNIILDSRRLEKYQPLMDELKRQGITNYEIWPCKMLPSVVSSINNSHKMIVRDAMEKGEEETVICEDDLMFVAKDGWRYFLSKKPKEYDLYLAATYILPVENNKICGFHLYFIHSRFYEKFLSVPDTSHIDTAMDDLNGEYHFCYPFAALQRAGYSANNGMITNYNQILEDKDVYGGKPK